jgi:hypothetical protein
MGFLRKYIEDLLILSGLVIIAGTTFFISIFAGFYLTGAIMVGLGIYFARFPPKEVE